MWRHTDNPRFHLLVVLFHLLLKVRANLTRVGVNGLSCFEIFEQMGTVHIQAEFYWVEDLKDDHIVPHTAEQTQPFFKLCNGGGRSEIITARPQWCKRAATCSRAVA